MLALLNCYEPYLKLELVKETEDENYKLSLYRQRNIKVTRKQLLPIVQRAVLKYEVRKRR